MSPDDLAYAEERRQYHLRGYTDAYQPESQYEKDLVALLAYCRERVCFFRTLVTRVWELEWLRGAKLMNEPNPPTTETLRLQLLSPDKIVPVDRRLPTARKPWAAPAQLLFGLQRSQHLAHVGMRHHHIRISL